MKNMETILAEMANLIEQYEGQTYWSSRLNSLARKVTLHEDDFRLAVKQLFGGMGSLNDFGICDKDGKYPLKANEDFDDLKKELREALRA